MGRRVIMKPRLALTLATVITGAVQPVPVFAQTAEEMVETLKPKAGKTRSATGEQAGLPAEDQQLIDEIKGKTRGERAVIVEEREKLIEVIDRNKLPSLDLDIYFAYDSRRSPRRRSAVSKNSGRR